MIFLGTGSAFVTNGNYQTNILLEDTESNHLLIDCGTDIRFSLHELGYDDRTIDTMYLSHLHADHVGGLEWLAFKTKFIRNKKVVLYVSADIVDDLWNKSLEAGLSSLPGQHTILSDFFDVKPLSYPKEFSWGKAKFTLVQAIHSMNNNVLMPCYGLFIDTGITKVYITGDSISVPYFCQKFYDAADIIFQDCETIEKPTHVHAHYNQLKDLPNNIKAKMWLVGSDSYDESDVAKQRFLGFVKKGQTFEV